MQGKSETITIPFLFWGRETDSKKSLIKKREREQTRQGSILIIDDEDKICQELSEILKDNNFRVLCAKNGRQAKKIIAQKSIDLVLLDLRLPDVNGLDLIKYVKESGEDTQIIVMTGFGSLNSAKEAVRKNIYDYITKPFSPEKIIKMIKRATTGK